METSTTAMPILVIDDETAILKLLKCSLSRKGYGVDTAANGREGIHKIENNEYSFRLFQGGISTRQIGPFQDHF
jgi:DNA-binding response OmpR family regulator